MKAIDDGLARKLGLSALDAAERRRLLKAFDADFYLAENPELLDRQVEPFTHFMTEGWRECRDPSAQFQTLDYLLSHREVLRSGSNPFIYSVLGKAAVARMEGRGRENQKRRARAALVAEPRETDWKAVPKKSARPAGCEKLGKAELAQLRDAFDADYYLQHNLDVVRAGVDPFQHYMSFGWRQLRDPSPNFSTEYYLSNYPDIAKHGENPFIHWVLHGLSERRPAISFHQRLELKPFEPMVSAIIPNYNHGPYLAQRIESILDQTYPHISLTILDDCSTDNSREIIQSYVDRFPGTIRAIFNTENSGGVFRQWRKGIFETEGDLVWICESDDFCEPDFVEKLIPHFRDEGVQIAFGRILVTDAAGSPNQSMDDYRESAEPGIWDASLVRPAAAWFAGGLGVRNVIANVGGCLFRRRPFPDAVWEEACTYKVVGDWFLYNHIAAGGQIAWEPEAIAYFRHHGANTSSTAQRGPRFYSELERLMLTLRNHWDIPASTVESFHSWIAELYKWFDVRKEHGPLKKHCSLDKLLAAERTQPHILIAMLGFTPGGGESFPIALANGLVESGWKISILTFSAEEPNVHMRRALNPAVSVYDAAWVLEYGAQRFIEDAGVSLIHSHIISAEMHFFQTWRLQTDVPYLVTLHGSYEASHLSPDTLRTITNSVDHFVYTADKNLQPFADLHLPESRFTKLANAMPVDLEPFPKTRSDMGIDEGAIVFTLVARGIKRKGWRAALEAFTRVRDRHPEVPMHLCLVGEGEEPDRHEVRYGSDPDISFLGYQPHVTGLYRMTDVAIVPTRFAGESYPLCIIQAFQVGTPVIASDAGEIRSMLVKDGGLQGGLVIDAVRDTPRFIDSLTDAMESMLDAELRKKLASDAAKLGQEYDMGKLVETYGRIYRQLIDGDASESKLTVEGSATKPRTRATA